MNDTSSINHEKIAGLAGFGFAVGVLLQNAILLQGMPLPGAEIDDVLAFYTSKRAPASIATGWVAINIPLLLAFGSGISERLARDPRSSLWARVGLVATVLLAAAFSVTTALQALLLARAEALHAASLLGVIWDLHTAAFAMSGTALAVVLGAFSLGARATPVVPKWVGAAGVAGAISLVVAGLLVVGTVEGGPGIFFQLAGFAAWLAFVIAGSLRLMRAHPAALPT